MFGDLPPSEIEPTLLQSIGGPDGPLARRRAPAGYEPSNPAIPAGFAILARLVEHDASYHAMPVENGRRGTVPRLALDCMYGDGPLAAPCFYDGPRLLMGTESNPAADLARNRIGMALIADPRNDADRLLAQLHLAFIKFHNVVVDDLAASGLSDDLLFGRAAREVRWHYQWLLLHEFLPLLIGEDHADRLRQQGPRFYRHENDPRLPAEFAAAAIRFHLSQSDEAIDPDDETDGDPLAASSGGFGPIPASSRVDWRYLFEMPRAGRPRPSRKIDGYISNGLLTAATVPVIDTLVFGNSCQLPHGQAVARHIGATPLTNDELGLAEILGPAREAPLWLYVLKEAEFVRDGVRLGPVGATIVGDVVLDLIQRDPASYRNTDTHWQPSYGVMGSCQMSDLLVASDYYRPTDLGSGRT